jgi:hypothetical protein
MKWYKNTKLGDQRPIAQAHTTSIGSGMTPINFQNIGGKVYRYLQPHMQKFYRINLQRIDPKATGN